MKIVKVFGMSHTNALRAARERELTKVSYALEILHLLVEIQDKNFIDENGSETRLHPKLHEKFSSLPINESFIFSQIGGNSHSFVGLFEHATPFDFILPNQRNLPLVENAEILPYHYIYAILQANLQAEFKIFHAARNSIATHFYHLESPPPIRDNAFCTANLPPTFKQGKYAKMSVAMPYFRYKIWRLHSNIVHAECEKLGMKFIPCPTTSMDSDGFLLPKYYIDPLHGNDLYGALVLDQISNIVNEPEAIL
jgi:hypothetical protein